jgi:serine O-acetyltransferase
MAVHQVNPQGSKLAALDPIWERVRGEAEDIVRREPELASFIYSTVLHHERLEDSVIHRIAERLDHSALSGDLIRQTYDEALRDEPDLGNAFRADLVAVYDRDPATSRFIDPLLYFKGFHALQTHRLAHWLYQKGRKDFAYYLQSRSSAVFQTDINPAAKIGRGIFLDHATGFVCGETAVIDDDVSILHGVTLGGTGKENEDRHPKIRRGVLIGAGRFSAISRSAIARASRRARWWSSRCRTTLRWQASPPRSSARRAVRSRRAQWIRCSARSGFDFPHFLAAVFVKLRLVVCAVSS